MFCKFLLNIEHDISAVASTVREPIKNEVYE